MTRLSGLEIDLASAETLRRPASDAAGLSASHLETTIARGIVNFFCERVGPNHPIMILLVKPPIIFRPPSPDGEKKEPLPERPWRDILGWRPVNDLLRAYSLLLSRVPEIVEITCAWRPVTLTYSTIVACEWASLLSQQMGCLTNLISIVKMRPDFAELLSQCENEAEKAEALIHNAVELMVREVPPKTYGAQPNKLRLEVKDGGIRVFWIGNEGAELGEESLHEFALRTARPAANELAREATRLMATQGRIRDTGNKLLAEISPKIAKGLKHACDEQRIIRAPICQTRIRNLPVEVSLYMDPGGRRSASPNVMIAARRAHEEFVLENDTGELFYFQPIQVVAALSFWGKRWYTYANLRLPKNSPQWCHPYTGRLRDNPFDAAPSITETPPEAMLPISPAGRRLLGSNVVHTPVDMCGDLCVEHQDTQIRELQARVLAAQTHGARPDLLGLARGLWDIARIALTRAHQLNQNTPRANLNGNNMFYPVRDRALLAGTMASRVFAYNPHRPVVVG